MKVALLHTRFEKMPLLKALLAVIIGLIIGAMYPLPMWVVGILLGIGGLLIAFTRLSIGIWIALVAAGLFQFQIHREEPFEPFKEPTSYLVQVDQIHSLKPRNSLSSATIHAQYDPHEGQWNTLRHSVMLWGDSVVRPHEQAFYIVHGTPRLRPSYHAPYARFSDGKGWQYTLQLNPRTTYEVPKTILHKPKQRTERIPRLFDRLQLKAQNQALVHALCLGDRSLIQTSLRKEYTASGFSHLLALSGMHTVMVFFWINLLFWLLPLLWRGHIGRDVAALTLLWLFVAMTRFMPSVVRAATMCTFLQLANMAGGSYRGINALSVAALIMLLWEPLLLWDYSFRLSFLAAFAIVAWGLPLCRLVRFRWGILNTLKDSYFISLVATTALAPMIGYLFGIFPLFSLLFAPIAIFIALTIVSVGVLRTIFSAEWFDGIFTWALNTLGDLMNGLTEFTAGLPHEVINLDLNGVQTALLYLIYAIFTLYLWCLPSKKELPLPHDHSRRI